MIMRTGIRRLVSVVPAAILAVIVSAGCGGGSASTGASGGTVKIGALIPLTGPLAFYGPLFRDAIRLRLKEANAKAGGKKVEVIFKDESGDLATAQTNAKELVEQDGVNMMIGPLNAGTMAGLAPYYAQHHVPTIALLNLPIELGKSGWIFTPQGSLSGVTAPMGTYAYDHMGVRTATVQGSDYIGGRRIVGGFEVGFKRSGGKIVQQQWPPLGTTDFGSYLSNLKSADALAAWYPGAQQNFMTQYFQRGKYKNTIIPYGDVLPENTLDQLGPKMVGTKAALTYTWRLDTPANQKFVRKYQRAYHRVPVTEIDEGAYEDLTVALMALDATKGNTDPDALRKAIVAEKLETPAGPVRFDKTTRMGVRNVYILNAERIAGKLGWASVATYKNVQPTAGTTK